MYTILHSYYCVIGEMVASDPEQEVMRQLKHQ